VRKFAARLDEMIAPAELAAERGELPDIATFAHWLAGAAGTVGYDAFTGPARELERFALSGDNAGVSLLMVQLRQMANRIEPPAGASMPILPTAKNQEAKLQQ
jgi:hypothetical protein